MDQPGKGPFFLIATYSGVNFMARIVISIKGTSKQDPNDKSRKRQQWLSGGMEPGRVDEWNWEDE